MVLGNTVNYKSMQINKIVTNSRLTRSNVSIGCFCVVGWMGWLGLVAWADTVDGGGGLTGGSKVYVNCHSITRKDKGVRL